MPLFAVLLVATLMRYYQVIICVGLGAVCYLALSGVTNVDISLWEGPFHFLQFKKAMFSLDEYRIEKEQPTKPTKTQILPWAAPLLRS